MTCPYCGHPDQKVLESRDAKDGVSIRRRRECLKCQRRFTTFEGIEKVVTYVVKRDGTREEFLVEKLLRSMIIACRKRGVPIEILENSAQKIENRLAGTGYREIPSHEIGGEILKELYQLDSVAYVRFASVYKKFNSLEDFEKIIATAHQTPPIPKEINEKFLTDSMEIERIY